MALVHNRNEDIVAEAVVIIKKLLQLRPTEHDDMIASLAKSLDKV